MVTASEYLEKTALSANDAAAAAIPFIATGNPLAGYSGYKGKKDKDKGKNKLLKHTVGGALGYPAMMALASGGRSLKHAPLTIGAGLAGGAVHGASYATGRLFGKNKKRKKDKK
jgi:hypothetical protein